MANTQFSFTKAIALTQYMKAFRIGEGVQGWEWEKVYTRKKTDKATEQVFSYNGLPVARLTGELEPVYYADMSENAATTFTVQKFTLASIVSRELQMNNLHLPDFMKELGSSAGESQQYVRNVSAAAAFNRAFSSSYTLWDGVELCGTHTLKDGTSFDNDLTPASLTFDNLWLAVNAFETTIQSHAGLYLVDKPKYLIYHPSKEKEVRALLKTTEGQPGTANNDYNSLRDYNLEPIPCRFLTTSTYWFVLGSKAKRDFIWLDREGVKTEMEDDFDLMASKVRSSQFYAVGVRDFNYAFGNPGA